MIVCFKWNYQQICSVNNATLNRFFSLHFVLPFVLAALALMHLIVLHDTAGWVADFYSTILGNINYYLDRYFSTYYQVIYLITTTMFIISLSIFVFWVMDISENFSEIYNAQSYLFVHNIKPLNPLSVRKHSYSTTTMRPTLPIKSQIQPSLNDFYDWFCGLADAESCFFFRIRARAIEFEFKISLHLDDLSVLLFIQEKLGIGKVDTSSGMASFRVNKQSELWFLIEMFEKFPLNSTKYLNYLDFKKALELYNSSKSALTKQEINKLKCRMNKLRTDLTMPDFHKLRITPHWVLGFIEVEGSFSVQKVFPFSLTFSLTQKKNTYLMKALQEFFQSLAISHNGLNKQNAIRVSWDNRIGNKGDITSLHVSSVDYITNVLIPFFDGLTWSSKKEKDYNDWKTVLELKKLGLHYTEQGVTVINLILSQMNLNRLSTNTAKMSQIQLDSLQRDIVKLLTGPSNLEVEKDGRILIKSLNKYYTGSGSVKVELQDKNGLIVYTFGSISECAKFLDLAPGTVTTRLQKSMPVVVDNKELFVYKRLKQDSNE